MTSGKMERRRLYLFIFYESPWERLATWLWGIDRETNELKGFEVPDGCLRDKLADWCDRRNTAWMTRYAASGRLPPARWLRSRSSGTSGSGGGKNGAASAGH